MADKNYLRELVKSGLKHVFFSFDGFKPEIYKILRDDINQYGKKLKALENLKKLHIRTSILSVIVKGVNEDQIPKLIRYVVKNNFIWMLSLRYLNIHGVDKKRRNFNKENLISIEEMLNRVSQTLGIRFRYYDLFYEMRYLFHKFISSKIPSHDLDYLENRRIYLRRSPLSPAFSEEELEELISIFKNRKFYKLLNFRWLPWVFLFAKNRFKLGLVEWELYRKGFFTITVNRPPLTMSDFLIVDKPINIVYFPEPFPVFQWYIG